MDAWYNKRDLLNIYSIQSEMASQDTEGNF